MNTKKLFALLAGSAFIVNAAFMSMAYAQMSTSGEVGVDGGGLSVNNASALETFGSVERFKEILSHQEQEFNSKIEPTGEKPTDEEDDMLWDFLSELDYEREDDWWTDRKGGYDVTYSYIVDENK